MSGATMPDPLFDADVVPPTRETRSASWLRSLTVIVAATITVAVGVDQALRLWIGAAFGGPDALPGAIIAIAAIWVIVAALVAVSTLLTGRFRWWIGAAAPTLGGVITIAYLARGRGFPIDWFSVLPLPAWPTLVIGAVAALAAGVLLPAWWSRFAGAIAVLSVVAFLFIPGVQASWYAADDAAAARAAAEHEAKARAQRAESFDHYVTTSVPPAAPASGLSPLDEVRGGPDSTVAFLTAPSGAGVTTITDRTRAWETNEAYPCWILADSTVTFRDSDPLEALGSWCVRDDRGWSRTDGSGVAFVVGEYLVVVRAARDVEVAGARPATAADIEDVRASVRLLDPEEFRAEARADFMGTAR